MATPVSSSNAKDPATNSIRRSKGPHRQPNVPSLDPERPSTTSSNASANANAVPEAVAKRFVQVRSTFYFPDGARAFTDRGNRLTTPSENTEVVRSLILIAKAREWNEITVRGTERFRREAWLAARLAGLEVRGYQPTEVEQAHLVRSFSRRNAVSAGDSPVGPADTPPRRPDAETPEPDRRGALLTGTLIDHGRATYQHDPHQPMSYFVKIETPRADRIIWGVDLERAFKESLTKPQAGEEVGLRAVRQDTVKVKNTARAADGKVAGMRELETHRNRWIVEKREFFEARAQAARTVRDTTVAPKQAVKQHPELVGTYLQMHAAELAAKRFRDPEDRERFVAKVRSALADSVARGEPLPPVRLRERPQERTPRTNERDPPLVPG
jgi:Large polyvalent protein-associated domain 7